MFAAMRLHIRLTGLLPLLFLGACRPPSGTGTTTGTSDTTWAGEVSVLDGRALFRPCAQETGLPLEGPALDSVLAVYRSQAIQPGQRMMAWIKGHLAASAGRPADTVFIAESLGQLDALRMCPLIPLPRLSARYGTVLVEHLGNRSLTLDLYPNGTALQLTEMRDRPIPFEQEGHWGADGNGLIEVDFGPSFPKGYYTSSGDTLVRIGSRGQGSGERFTLMRTGAAEPKAGVRGMVVEWLNAVASVHCTPLDRGRLTATTPLTDLFPNPTAMQALEDSAISWLPLDTTDQHLGERGLVTVGALVERKRRALLLRQ